MEDISGRDGISVKDREALPDSQAVRPGAGADRLMEQVRRSLCDLTVGNGLEHVGDQDLVDLLRRVESLGTVVDAVRAMGAAEVERRSRTSSDEPPLCTRFDCRTSTDLLTRITGASRSTVLARVRSGRFLERRRALTGDLLPARLPLTRTAWEAGLIGIDTVKAMASTLGAVSQRPHHPDLLTIAEGAVLAQTLGVNERGTSDQNTAPGRANPVDACATVTEHDLLAMSTQPLVERMVLPADVVGEVAALWAGAIDPDGAVPDERERERGRGLMLSPTRNGLVRISGHLLPEVAAQLQRLLDAVTNPAVAASTIGKDPAAEQGGQVQDSLFSSDDEGEVDNAAQNGADPDRGDRDPHWNAENSDVSDPGLTIRRTRAERMHDALASVLTRAATRESMPTLRGAAPTLVVTCTVDDLADPGGIARLSDAPIGRHHVAAAVITSHSARRLACNGVIERVLMGDAGRIIALDSTSRVFTAHQRRAIEARDGGCVIPGCTVGPAWCEVHHVHEHSQGGPTHTDNGVLLCWHHHRALHAHGWQVRMVNGTVQVKPPRWLGVSADGWRPAQGSATLRTQRQREVVDRFWTERTDITGPCPVWDHRVGASTTKKASKMPGSGSTGPGTAPSPPGGDPAST
ncbi:DUF222 domain-containing protein [Schaalia sp. 19OD2882]|uniref:HNH endonuclease signature motif containing protein n=1 Tax=Schaalia sp. 19OD2882 TaxID=2794089 RepID=UPI001C1EA214|nr:HNH endonuclease signature motif containing protein [Schaalia sp. 19OD2882]QWW19318.1 DUF222 domain-containing protein [Schaalia sp. 19OD2882]